MKCYKKYFTNIWIWLETGRSCSPLIFSYHTCMYKRIAPFLLSCFLWLGLLGWWVSQWPEPIPVQEASADTLWRSISKTSKGWAVTTYKPNANWFLSYQKGGLLLYGNGPIASVNHGDVTSISLPDGGQWIIKSLDPDLRIQLKSSVVSGDLVWEGAVFIDTLQKNMINFDMDMTANKEKVLPSFLRTKDRQIFFDISEQKDVISPDLWSLYSRFLPLDQVRVLGNVKKRDIDTLIRTLLAREPEKSQWLLEYDLRARNGLNEISVLLGKIEKWESCGADVATCFSVLDETINKNLTVFPEVFQPVQKAVRAWLQLDTQTQQNVFTWKHIFHTYHNNLLANEPRARAIRDGSILEMVRTGASASQYEVWQYLTRMLADQKLGSVYSMQIMREMIRIGEALMAAKDTPETVRSTLTSTGIESLRNLKNLLENAYFTKKEYWFVLRTDLLDSQWKAIETESLTKDLQGLIEEIDRSPLLKTSPSGQNTQNDLATIRGQLAWFRCIFNRNAEYVANPRVCRITVSQ